MPAGERIGSRKNRNGARKADVPPAIQPEADAQGNILGEWGDSPETLVASRSFTPGPWGWQAIRLEAFIIASAPYRFDNDKPLWATVQDGMILMAQTLERPYGTLERPLGEHAWTVYGEIPPWLACCELAEHFDGWIIGTPEVVGQISELWGEQVRAGSKICDILTDDGMPVEIHEATREVSRDDLAAIRAERAATNGGAA